MRLREYQGKKLFSSYSIPVPFGIVVSSSEEAAALREKLPDDCVLKAQVKGGKRGKGGKIIFCGKSAVALNVKKLVGKKHEGEAIKEVLVEEQQRIKREVYLGITLNRADKCFTLVFSKKGGVDIEQVALETPKKIITHNIRNGIPSDLLPEKITLIARKLWKLVRENNCLLAEINPLAETREGKYVALDSKIVIDDNIPNPIFREEAKSFEQKAKEKGIHYVQLEGDMGIIGNGAGLVMATMDIISAYGGRPADFLDVGGGADEDKMIECLGIVEINNPKGIFINIFGGITRCDTIAKAIVKWHRGKSMPIVVRMIGTNEKKARSILEKSGIHAISSMEEGARKILRV